MKNYICNRKALLIAALLCAAAALGVLAARALMPRTITASDGDSCEVSVTYGPRAKLPAGVTLSVSELTGERYEAYYRRTVAELGAVDVLRAFDIRCLAPDGAEVEPAADVKVSFRIKGVADSELTRILHFSDGARMAPILPGSVLCRADGYSTLDFRTDSFSVYVLTTDRRVTYTFHESGGQVIPLYINDAGDTVETQTVRAGERPVVPVPESADGQLFAGWYEETDESKSAFDFANATPGAYELYPIFGRYVRVTFHDRFDGGTFPVARMEYLPLDAGGGASVRLDNFTVPYHDDVNSAAKRFVGWSATPISDPGSDTDDQGNPVARLGDSLDISEDADFYPIFDSVYWLSFYSAATGEGATYFPAKSYFGGRTELTGLDTPLRKGYDFTGWWAGVLGKDDNNKDMVTYFDAGQITDEEGNFVANAADSAWTKIENGKLTLKEDLILFAKWAENPAAPGPAQSGNWYKVVIDPNGGSLELKTATGVSSGSQRDNSKGSTWLWMQEGGKVEEYTWATRDYEESVNGNYYYHYDRRSDRWGEAWTAAEDEDRERYAYYTRDASDATDLSATYAERENLYRYAGWYEVTKGADGTPIETRYDFDAAVNRDLYLKLHWLRTGAARVVYNTQAETASGRTVTGAFSGSAGQDGPAWIDGAQMTVDRSLTAERGWHFTGWTVRGDGSGRVYRPGDALTLDFSLTVNVDQEDVLFLDPVFEQAKTAKIIYDANGGVIADSGELDYGAPAAASPAPVRVHAAGGATAAISNLANNSDFTLSGGAGFSNGAARLAGWCANPVYDPDDLSAPLFAPGANCVADAESVLYAIWDVTVRYHLNPTDPDSDTASWGGAWDSSVYQTANLDSGEQVYTRTAYIGSPAAEPAYTPEDAGAAMFLYWSASRDGEAYDFTQGVAQACAASGALDLYARWSDSGSQVTVAAFAAAASKPDASQPDASRPKLTAVSDGEDGSLFGSGGTGLQIPKAGLTLSDAAPARAGYVFAFAAPCRDGAAASEQISEADAITRLTYNSAAKKVFAAYADGRTPAPLGADEKVCFVYYAEKSVDITWQFMDADAADPLVLSADSAPALNALAPTGTGPLGANEYDMAADVSAPRAWAGNNLYPYYAFAVSDGQGGLDLVTAVSGSDAARPALRLRNTWRGFQYAADGGRWTDCGYETELFVLFFDKQPNFITIREQTVGTRADRENEAFSYSAVIRQDGEEKETLHFELKNGASRQLMAYYWTDGTGEHTQTVAVTQAAKAGYSTEVYDVENDTSAREIRLDWSYATRDGGKPHDVTFINTRSALTPAYHVAAADGGGALTLRDGWKKEGAVPTSFTLNDPAGTDLTAKAGSLAAPEAGYVLAGVVCCDPLAPDAADGSAVTCRAGVGRVRSAAYKAEGADGLCALRLRDSGGAELGELGDGELCYVYCALPRLYYVRENPNLEYPDNGSLTLIEGTTPGQITANSYPLRLNRWLTPAGVPAEQGQTLPLSADGVLTISQSEGANHFKVPLDLDGKYNEEYKSLWLRYARLGVGGPGAGELAGLTLADGKQLRLRIGDSLVPEWSADGASWQTFGGAVYAVYKERGHDLVLRKTVIGGSANPYFDIVIASDAIRESSYAVTGAGSAYTVTPYAGPGTTGRITARIRNGGKITVSGLPTGSYTVTETPGSYYTLSYVELNGDNYPFDPSGEITVDGFTDDVELRLTNKHKSICRIGSKEFMSFYEALDDMFGRYTSATIEMLLDYPAPSNDLLQVLADYDIVLTTAADYTSEIPGKTAATISRGDGNTAEPLIENSGSLTIRNVTLDGANISCGKPLVYNEGALTLDGGVTLQNASCTDDGAAIHSLSGAIYIDGSEAPVLFAHNRTTKNGGAICAESGSVTLKGGAAESDGVPLYGVRFTDNTARENGGALYYSGGGDVVLDGYTSLSGDTAETGNRAKNGGAIYAVNGQLDLGLSVELKNNTASEGGGAIYSDSAAVTLGGTLSGNRAKNGGALYTDKTVSISIPGKTTLSGNRAAENGGAIFMQKGVLEVTAARCELSGNQAGECGGAAYLDAVTARLNAGSLTGNRARNGAAVFTVKGDTTFSGVSVTGNISSREGGAVGVGAVNGSEAALLTFSGSVQIRDNHMAAEGEGDYWLSGEADENMRSNVYLDQDAETIIKAEGLSGAAEVGVYVPDVPDAPGGPVPEEYASKLFRSRGQVLSVFGFYTDAVPTNLNTCFVSDRVQRLSGGDVLRLHAMADEIGKKILWGWPMQLEVRYLENFWSSREGFPAKAMKNGAFRWNGAVKAALTEYYPPSSANAASVLASDVYAQVKSKLDAQAVFAAVFADTDGAVPFGDYLTDIDWDSATSSWALKKRDGTAETQLDKIVIYYAKPLYFTVENNTDHTLNLARSADAPEGAPACEWKVLSRSVLGDGYGYVVSRNGSTMEALRPVTAAQLRLQKGESINLLFPGGYTADYILSGYFEGTITENIPVTWTGVSKAPGLKSLTPAEALAGFAYNDASVKTAGAAGTTSVVFGGERKICKIVDAYAAVAAADGALKPEWDGESAGTAGGKAMYTHTFRTIQEALAYVEARAAANGADADIRKAVIQMLADYTMPDSDKAVIPRGYDITLTTAHCTDTNPETGAPVDPAAGRPYYSDGNSTRRATIGRAPGNKALLIQQTTAGSEPTVLRIDGVNFDGKNVSGNIDGGAIRTMDCRVIVRNANFVDLVANNGGAMFVEYKLTGQLKDGGSYVNVSEYAAEPGQPSETAQYWLIVEDCSFTSCRSISTASRVGGGAVWTNAKYFVIRGSDDNHRTTFKNCSAMDQGGALFHRVDANYDEGTTSLLEYCSFTDCEANAAGGMESDAQHFVMRHCGFLRCKARTRNGGAANIYVMNAQDPKVDSSVTVEDCTFDNCQAESVAGTYYGGALRSNATENTVRRCYVRDCFAVNGGGIACSNANAESASGKATFTVIENCTVTGCSALTKGGGIYSRSKELTITGYLDPAVYGGRGGGVTVANCRASDNGGGVCHENNNAVTATLDGVVIQSCLTYMNGGGLYTNVKDLTLKDTTITDCRAMADDKSNGGGVCHNGNQSGTLTLNGVTIESNTAAGANGGKGGGVYCGNSGVVMGNGSSVSFNRLGASSSAPDAAGVYMGDGKGALTLCKFDEAGAIIAYTGNSHTADESSVRENYLLSGEPSNLRLPESGGKNKNSVTVRCNLAGTIGVVNAKNVNTQFGTSDFENPDVGSDSPVFQADSASLVGVVKDKTKIVWGDAPIAKIMTSDGEILYKDPGHRNKAVYKELDNGTREYSEALADTYAFAALRTAQPLLYTASSVEPYAGDYRVCLLAENVALKSAVAVEKYTYVSGGNTLERTIVLTTAKRGDTDGYPYRGRINTVCTLRRESFTNNMFGARGNLAFESITIDGGSGNSLKTGDVGGIVSMKYDTQGVTVTVGQGATLQNSETSDRGGAVYVGAKGDHLRIRDGGAIRGCSAGKEGGGVYLAEGDVTLRNGAITLCKAGTNGGGIYVSDNANVLSELSGSVTGSKVNENEAALSGGGIYLSGKNSRLAVSGLVEVKGNTAGGGSNNVALSSGISADPEGESVTDIITSKGLSAKSEIGVYLPGGASDSASLYQNHGLVNQKFANFTGSNNANLDCFVNDREQLRGGQIKNGGSKVYWVEIFMLDVSKVVSSYDTDDSDPTRKFQFTITLSQTAQIVPDATINGKYGAMTFNAGVAHVALSGSEEGGQNHIVGKWLPYGLYYEVREEKDNDFRTVNNHSASSAGSGLVAAGKIGENLNAQNAEGGGDGEAAEDAYTNMYTSYVVFQNIKAVCKITDADAGLLYYKNGTAYAPAVYGGLKAAFSAVNKGELFYKDGGAWKEYYRNDCRVELLIPGCTLTDEEGSVTLDAARRATLTTASAYATDGYRYMKEAGTDPDTAVIRRDSSSGSLFTVNGSLTLANIRLDGATAAPVTGSGGLVYVGLNGSLTALPGAELKNSAVTGMGGAIHAGQKSVVKIEGCLISGCSAAKGGAVSMEDTSAVDIFGGTVLTQNTAAADGGALYVGGGTCKLYGGSRFTANEAKNGGALYVGGGTCKLYGGSKFTANEAKNGGALYMANGDVTLSGGSVIGGSESGDANKSTGSVFTSTAASLEGGGGAYIAGGKLTVTGDAKITGNTAVNGGGVCQRGGTLNFSAGCAITDNSAVNGGGVLFFGGNGNYSGGVLKNNTCTNAGAGVFVMKSARLYLSGYVDFGGRSITAGNRCYNDAEKGDGANGQEHYGDTIRQDIYLAQKANGKLESLQITGSLNPDNDPDREGAVWVWLETSTVKVSGDGSAVTDRHYVTDNGLIGKDFKDMKGQFALFGSEKEVTRNGKKVKISWREYLDAELSPSQAASTLAVFRNAQINERTGCTGHYYTAQVRDVGTADSDYSFVFWGSAGADLIFQKTDGFGAPLNGAAFALYDSYANAAAGGGTGRLAEAVSAKEKNIEGVVHFTGVPEGVWYLRETAGVTDENGVAWASDAVYAVLAGEKWLTVPSEGEKTDEWAGVLSLLKQEHVSGQLDKAKRTEAFKQAFGEDACTHSAVFPIDAADGSPTKGKAAAQGDVARLGIANRAAREEKVILRKTDANGAPLSGAVFELLRADGTAVAGGLASGDSSGVIWIGMLPYGTYYLHETKNAALGDVDLWFSLQVDEAGAHSPASCDSPL